MIWTTTQFNATMNDYNTFGDIFSGIEAISRFVQLWEDEEWIPTFDIYYQFPLPNTKRKLGGFFTYEPR